MDPLDALANFGLPAVVLAILLAWAARQHDRVVAERNEAWSDRDDLTETILTKVTPALDRATTALQAREELEDMVVSHLVEAREVLIDVRRLLEGRG